MNEEVTTQEKYIIPVSISSMDEGFKYLGFQLKPNAYTTQDWMCLYKKIESIIAMWTNRFLSRGGWLVLLKAVLQRILVYWASISYIPKGLLARIKEKKVFHFYGQQAQKKKAFLQSSGRRQFFLNPEVAGGDQEPRPVLQSIGS